MTAEAPSVPSPPATPAPLIEARHWRTWTLTQRGDPGGFPMRGRMLGLLPAEGNRKELVKMITYDGETADYEFSQFSPEDIAYIRAVAAGREPVNDGAWLTQTIVGSAQPEVLLPPQVRPERDWTLSGGTTLHGKLMGLLNQSGTIYALVMVGNFPKPVKLADLSAADTQYIEDVKIGKEP